MPTADSSDVDIALMDTLANDATLTALLPDGVWWQVADPEAQKVVIVSQVEHDDAYVLPNRTAWERFVYLVKAVTFGKSGTNVKHAAARIHELLQHGTFTAPPNYHPPSMIQRVERVKYVEVDEPTNTRWQHRGGHYEVTITPL